MTSIEVPVTLEAPPAPKIAKRKVKAAEKAEKVHKKIAKSKSKGRKFWSKQILTKNTHTEALRGDFETPWIKSLPNKRQPVCFVCLSVSPDD